jgi:hypothetical protein
MDIPYTDLNFEQIIEDGIQKMADDKAASAKATQDNLRGGNSGCIVDGDVYGCHRGAIARALGYDIPADSTSRLFFAAGEGIEQVLSAQLDAGWSGIVRAEEEIPVDWKLPTGRRVTGRPDFVLLEQPSLASAEPIKRLGVELKTIVSEGGAHRVWFDHLPDVKHLCQSAHYMWQHETPWVLTYVCPIKCSVNHWKRKEHNLPFSAKINPFRAHFYLSLRDGTVWYRDVGTGEDRETKITVRGVQQFYELVDECITTKSLYLTPASCYADGSPMPFKHENYCEYCEAATEAGGDWDRWLDELSSKIHERKNA